jgi:hypothetical protein
MACKNKLLFIYTALFAIGKILFFNSPKIYDYEAASYVSSLRLNFNSASFEIVSKKMRQRL